MHLPSSVYSSPARQERNCISIAKEEEGWALKEGLIAFELRVSLTLLLGSPENVMVLRS